MTSDEVCEKYSNLNAKISVTELDEDLILIKGTKVGLTFLGELFLAHANTPRDPHSQIWPTGPGAGFFSRSSTKGFYILRVDDETELVKTSKTRQENNN